MKCDELESFTAESFGDGKCEVYEAVEVDAAIAELKEKLENVQASMYCNVVDAGMENRRLKRALWLARAERAHLKVLEYWPDYCHNAHCRIAEQKWDKVERKCRAMAEKFK